jgi:pimeloyl-ACP methyl ester carboxylesterase
MQTVSSQYMQIDGAQVYYEEAGQGRALVLVHAGFVDSRMWDAQFEAFAQHYRTVRFDQRGFGKSDALEGPVDRSLDLLHLLQHLGIEQAVLVGCSLGGEVILDFALQHPHMVSALVPVSTVPGGFEMQGEPPAELFEMMAALEQNDVQRASELQLRLWVDGKFRQPQQVDAGVRQRAAEMNRIPIENKTFLKAVLAPVSPLDPPVAARLATIHVPVLIVAGALDHPEVLRAADVMEAAIPAAQKIILPESAHLPSMEQPKAFNRAVLAFLQSSSQLN